MGPSSSHTMGPLNAARCFREKYPGAHLARVTLHGSLSLTGKGHMTDQALAAGLSPVPCEVLRENDPLPFHPNGMTFRALDQSGRILGSWRVYSTGGGEIQEESRDRSEAASIYILPKMTRVLEWAQSTGRELWELVEEREGSSILEYLDFIWIKMQESVQAGLNSQGELPGGLHLQRKARTTLLKTGKLRKSEQRTGLIAAYALAAAEHNAGGGFVVTAPTCGSCGVLPALLNYLQDRLSLEQESVLRALATAGLVGNMVKHNASISGADVGCQGEIGTASAMAAAAAAQLLGGNPAQVEYAAEMGLEHHLGLTCDPIMGLVQVPCIERNALAAVQALACAEYALLTDGQHLVSFDQVVETMKQTGHDLPSLYRETSLGGLARVYRRET